MDALPAHLQARIFAELPDSAQRAVLDALATQRTPPARLPPSRASASLPAWLRSVAARVRAQRCAVFSAENALSVSADVAHELATRALRPAATDAGRVGALRGDRLCWLHADDVAHLSATSALWMRVESALRALAADVGWTAPRLAVQFARVRCVFVRFYSAVTLT